MPSTEELFTDIDERLDQALSLTVGRMIEDRLEAHHLALAQDAADRLRSLCRSTRDRLAESEPVAYTATAELEDAEYFVIDDTDTLTELSVFRTLAAELAAMPQIAPSELDTTIKLYAIALGDDDERILFVRATNPQFRHTSGRFLAIGRERLRTVEGPIFAFAPDVDFVVGPRGWWC